MSPAAAVVEDVAARVVLDLLGLPPSASVGFVTGAQMANVTCLAAARNAVLARAGWDVEADGLTGAPPVTVFAGAQMHATIPVAVRAPRPRRRPHPPGRGRRPGPDASRPRWSEALDAGRRAR